MGVGQHFERCPIFKGSFYFYVCTPCGDIKTEGYNSKKKKKSHGWYLDPTSKDVFIFFLKIKLMLNLIYA